MTYVVTEDCIKCKYMDCIEVCPVDCFYEGEVGRFWQAKRMVPVTNVHLMGDIEVMGDGGLEFLREEVRLGARCRVGATTNARCIDFAHCERLGQDPAEVAKERELIQCL